MNQPAKIVDCTLRDGGYYSDWVFENTLVDNYLNAMNFSGVDIVEIGFRFTPKPKFLGVGHRLAILYFLGRWTQTRHNVGGF